MAILVVGGAGYIGSIMVKNLLRAGMQVVVLDNFCTGHRDALVGGKLIEVDLSDVGALTELFRDDSIDSVIHFASFIEVGESVVDPGKYYQNNFCATLSLLSAMVRAGVKNCIFSSSAAVYGAPEAGVRLDEQHPKAPVNPYGRSKWMVEQLLEDFHAAYGINYVALRYFNAAGADPEGALGERHHPETHLIPVLLQAAAGRRSQATIYGEDYPTPDGTCVRDYVHVEDLCRAHLLAIEYLQSGGASTAINLGNGIGFSIRSVLGAVERVTGRSVPVIYSGRRAGDSPILVADAGKAGRLLNWEPRWPDLDDMIRHAWLFAQSAKARQAPPFNA